MNFGDFVIDAADRKTAVVGPEKGQYRTLD